MQRPDSAVPASASTADLNLNVSPPRSPQPPPTSILSLPVELRTEIYKFLFPKTIWISPEKLQRPARGTPPRPELWVYNRGQALFTVSRQISAEALHVFHTHALFYFWDLTALVLFQQTRGRYLRFPIRRVRVDLCLKEVLGVLGVPTDEQPGWGSACRNGWCFTKKGQSERAREVIRGARLSELFMYVAGEGIIAEEKIGMVDRVARGWFREGFEGLGMTVEEKKTEVQIYWPGQADEELLWFTLEEAKE